MRLFLKSDNTQLKEYLFKKEIINRGDSLALGVSGGADSVAMLFFFYEIKDEYDLSITVKHFEHGIRGEESLSDMEFVKCLCKKLGVPFFCESKDVPGYASENGLSLEEAARHLRYEFLLKGNYDGLCLAHNFEDNAETVLFNLIRGTGIDGLCGMDEVSKREGKKIIRPLLRVKRADIEEYLLAKNVPYRQDSTNKDTVYSRNKIRNEIMPLFREINSETVLHINQAARDLLELKEYFDSENLDKYRALRDGEYLFCGEFDKIPPVFAKTFIRRFLEEESGSLKDVTRIHIDEIYNLAFKETGKRVDIPRGYVEKIYDKLAYRGKKSQSVSEINLRYKTKVFPYEKDMEIPKESYTKWFDYDKITSVPSLRFPEEGDYFTIDSCGNKKAFNRFCIDEKIPRDKRGEVPLFCLNHHIIWAVGHRISEAFKVTEDTKEILEIAVEET